MNNEQVSLLGILFTGIPFAIFLAKHNRASRALFAKLICTSILLIVGGIFLSEIGSPQLFGFFVVGWWMLYHAIALRYNDLGISKWKSLWSLIPIVLLFALFQCTFTNHPEAELRAKGLPSQP